MLCDRFINARRRIVQPAAAAAAAADTAADNHESSAAKRMKTMLQREARSQFWSAPSHATSVGYTSQTAAAAADEALSSTPSSTVSYSTSFCAGDCMCVTHRVPTRPSKTFSMSRLVLMKCTQYCNSVTTPKQLCQSKASLVVASFLYTPCPEKKV